MANAVVMPSENNRSSESYQAREWGHLSPLHPCVGAEAPLFAPQRRGPGDAICYRYRALAPPIGQLLLAAGLVTAEKLDEALQGQVVSGGRLGTNLIELGHVGLDDLAVFLGRQHALPPALERHFDSRDPALAELIEAEVAARWHAIPLYRSGASGEHIVVASTDPLPAEGLAELEDGLGAPILCGVAPELRILYWLERTYGIDRTNRFRRPGRAADSPAGTSPGAERRVFVRTLSDAEAPEPPSSLARIAVRRIAVPVSGELDLLKEGVPLGGVVKAIRRATGRNRVANLAMAALQNGFEGHVGAAVLLIARGGVALGWKGFVRARGDEAIEAVAIPLEDPSQLRQPFADKTPYIGPPQSPSLLDQRLWRLLRVPAPEAVAIFPIQLTGRVVALLYIHATAVPSSASTEGMSELALAIGAAFERLVRASQR